jgi:hypothetical protein
MIPLASRLLFKVFPPNGVVVAGRIGFHHKMRELLLRGLLKLVMLVHHRQTGVEAGGRSKEEAKPFGRVHKPAEYMCHCFPPPFRVQGKKSQSKRPLLLTEPVPLFYARVPEKAPQPRCQRRDLSSGFRGTT